MDSFNLLKGFLILWVIVGHKYLNYNVGAVNAVYDSIVGRSLGMGTMPAFFIIAGMTFRAMAPKKCLSKTFGELIKPYLYVMVAFAVCFPVMHYLVFKWWPGALRESTRYILAFLLGVPKDGKLVLGYELYTNTSVWFFIALFNSLNLLNLLSKLKSEKLRAIIVVFATVCGYILGIRDINYYCLPQSLIAVGYCYVGYLIKQYKLHASKYVR